MENYKTTFFCFQLFSVLYNDYNIRLKKKKVQDFFYQCPKSQELAPTIEKQASQVKAVKPPIQSCNTAGDDLITGDPQRSVCSNQRENATASAGQSVNVQKPLQGCWADDCNFHLALYDSHFYFKKSGCIYVTK